MDTLKQLIENNSQRLSEEKKRLEMLLGRIAKPKKAGGDKFEAKHPEYGDQDDENAAEVAAYETNLAEEHDLEPRLRKVDAALERIKSGTYGICKIGGEPLLPERLEAAPEAENCGQHEPR